MESTLSNFSQVSRNRLSQQVVEQIREMITSGELQTGTQLPPERRLAEAVGVSRGILREAINVLVQEGVLSVQVGRGTFVTDMRPEDFTDSLSNSISMMMRHSTDAQMFDHLYEVRLMLEVEIARLAAQRVNDEDITQLEHYLQKMIAHHDQVEFDYEAFLQADGSFHQTLAHITDNPLLETLLLPIRSLLRQMFHRTSSRLYESTADAIQSHREILEALRTRDPEQCQTAMGKHVRTALDWLKKAESDND